jgi:hypothetical protein
MAATVVINLLLIMVWFYERRAGGLPMYMNADDLRRLAAELAAEHGSAARDYAHRAVMTFQSEGEQDRARFWFALGIFLDDIMLRRLDPGEPIILQ